MKYIMRDIEGLLVHDDEVKEVCMSLKKFLNERCLRYGSSYQGRIDSMKRVVKSKGLVPLYVNSNELYISNKNIREYDVVFVNERRILSVVERANSKVRIVFDDLSVIDLDGSYKKIQKQIEYAKTFCDVIQSN